MTLSDMFWVSHSQSQLQPGPSEGVGQWMEGREVSRRVSCKPERGMP